MTWLLRIAIPCLLVVVVGLPVFMSSSQRVGRATGGGIPRHRLVVLTPHNEQIRYEFSHAFNQYRIRQGQPVVVFDWRVSGGTSDLRKLVFDRFAAKVKSGSEDSGIGVDLFFGGGDYEHGLLARGISTRRGDREMHVPLTMPIDIPPTFLNQVYPSQKIGSSDLYHPQRRWLGVALSSFGLVYNRDVLVRLGLDEPRTWSDLAIGEYFNWIALADPSHSGSIAVTYNLILRRLGWGDGWSMLRRVFANARYFASSASKIPVDVSAGEAAVGMCIDFYGRFQAGAIGGGRVAYVAPRYLTAITADPISILRGAPHPDLAHEFVLWLLRPGPQNLWQRRLDLPRVRVAPIRFELRRLPVRRDLYTDQYMQGWTDQVNPFDQAMSFPVNMPSFYSVVGLVCHAMAIDIHGELRDAWRAIISCKEPVRREKMIGIFDQMPSQLVIPWPDDELRESWREILHDDDHGRHHEVVSILAEFVAPLQGGMQDQQWRIEQRSRWIKFFRARYQQVRRLAESDYR